MIVGVGVSVGVEVGVEVSMGAVVAIGIMVFSTPLYTEESTFRPLRRSYVEFPAFGAVPRVVV